MQWSIWMQKSVFKLINTFSGIFYFGNFDIFEIEISLDYVIWTLPWNTCKHLILTCSVYYWTALFTLWNALNVNVIKFHVFFFFWHSFYTCSFSMSSTWSVKFNTGVCKYFQRQKSLNKLYMHIESLWIIQFLRIVASVSWTG